MASICVPVRGAEYYSFVRCDINSKLDIYMCVCVLPFAQDPGSFALVHGSVCDGWWKYLGKVVDVEFYVHFIYLTLQLDRSV